MIAARRLFKSCFAPLFSVSRMASIQIPKQAAGIKDKVMNRIQQQLKSRGGDSAASLMDVAETFKCVNYRYEFPQNLTDEQKSHMKRFDIFRHTFTLTPPIDMIQ